MKISMKAVVVAAGVSALLAVSVLPEAKPSAQITGQTPVPTPPPSGPPPRMANGKPGFQGVWQRPYVPDMTRSGRGQKGYAEAPFKNDDTAEARAALRQRGEFGELPYTATGLQAWKSYDISTLNAAD